MEERKWLAFDIETVKAAPEDSSASYALGVTCVATFKQGDLEPILWHGDFDHDSGRFPSEMTSIEVCRLSNYLLGNVYEDGFSVVGINSLGFDLRVLAEECQDPIVYDNLRGLAMMHFDPAFQMLCERGFMVGMKALGVGLQLSEQKTADMDGQKAVEMWTGSRADQDKVLEYVAQDARTTLAIAEALESKRWSWRDSWTRVVYKDRRAIRWLTKKNMIAHHHIANGLLPVSECLKADLPNTDWMENPWSREGSAGWALGENDG